MVKSSISSGQNESLRPHLNINRIIVTINKWSQNFILTTIIGKNGCLGALGPKMPKY